MEDRFKFRAILSANRLTILVPPEQIYTYGYMINMDEANKVFEEKYPNESTWEFWDEIQKQGDIQEHYHADLLIVKGFDKLIQCTGLKDKNGKLIFEGDILSDHSPYDEYIIEIRFCESCMQLQPNERPSKINDYCEDFECLACRSDLYLKEIKSSDFGIIGNIYENPKLLGDEI